MNLPEAFTKLIIERYPDGHPNGPYWVEILIGDTWFRAAGALSIESGLATLQPIGKAGPTTFYLEPKKFDDIELIL